MSYSVIDLYILLSGVNAVSSKKPTTSNPSSPKQVRRRAGSSGSERADSEDVNQLMAQVAQEADVEAKRAIAGWLEQTKKTGLCKNFLIM